MNTENTVSFLADLLTIIAFFIGLKWYSNNHIKEINKFDSMQNKNITITQQQNIYHYNLPKNEIKQKYLQERSNDE